MGREQSRTLVPGCGVARLSFIFERSGGGEIDAGWKDLAGAGVLEVDQSVSRSRAPVSLVG